MDQQIEVRVSIGDADWAHQFDVQHRFAEHPDAETLVALKQGAVLTWRRLFDRDDQYENDEPEECDVSVRYLPHERSWPPVTAWMAQP